MSTHAQVLRLRRVRSHLAIDGTYDVAFCLSGQNRHTEVAPLFMRNGGGGDPIGWPAFPFPRSPKKTRFPAPPLPFAVRRVWPSSLPERMGTREGRPCSWEMGGGGSSMAGLRYPSHGRSRQTGYPIRPSVEGRSSWLNLPRKTLSFSIQNRFYPGTP